MLFLFCVYYLFSSWFHLLLFVLYIFYTRPSGRVGFLSCVGFAFVKSESEKNDNENKTENIGNWKSIIIYSISFDKIAFFVCSYSFLQKIVVEFRQTSEAISDKRPYNICKDIFQSAAGYFVLDLQFNIDVNRRFDSWCQYFVWFFVWLYFCFYGLVGASLILGELQRRRPLGK